MLMKSYFPQIVFFLIILMILGAGCRISETDEVVVTTPGNLENTPTSIPTLTPSKTELPTQASTTQPSKTVSPTMEPSSFPTATIVPGATEISQVDGMILVYIPRGDFLMGSTDTDQGSDFDEQPQHIVSLDAYWIDQTVVTNAMYVAFLNKNGNLTEDHTTWLDAADEDVLIYQVGDVWQSIRGYENHPVVEVTWYGAQAYCKWVGRRLPTEAEWEKAARGPSTGLGDARIYPWGDEIDCDKAQYANCSGALLSANSKPAGASPYGVLGLSGNTWEWTADWYSDDYYALSPSENPKGPTEGETRVLRGASWEYDWKHLRAANRRHNGPAVSMHDYGFRCVIPMER